MSKKTYWPLVFALFMEVSYANNIIRVQAPVRHSPSGTINWVTHTPAMTDWADSGSPANCLLATPQESSMPQGLSFTQIASGCQQEQVRHRQERLINLVTGDVKNDGDAVVERQQISWSGNKVAQGSNPKAVVFRGVAGTSTSAAGIRRFGYHRSAFEQNSETGEQLYTSDGYGVQAYAYQDSNRLCYIAIGAANGSGWNTNPGTLITREFVANYTKAFFMKENGEISDVFTLPSQIYTYQNGHYKNLSITCAHFEALYNSPFTYVGLILN